MAAILWYSSQRLLVSLQKKPSERCFQAAWNGSLTAVSGPGWRSWALLIGGRLNCYLGVYPISRIKHWYWSLHFLPGPSASHWWWMEEECEAGDGWSLLELQLQTAIHRLWDEDLNWNLWDKEMSHSSGVKQTSKNEELMSRIKTELLLIHGRSKSHVLILCLQAHKH